MRMAGHHGNSKVTIENLEVVKIDLSNNQLLLKGSVPGSRNGTLIISKNKMKFDLHDLKGNKVSGFQLDDSIFGIKPNHGVVRQAILAELTNMRQGTHSIKK